MNPEEYLKRPYQFILIWDEESQTWTGTVAEFPGCIAQELSPTDIMDNL